MKFTVLGASGFIGRNLASHLADAGHEVFAPTRNDEGRFRGFLGHVVYCIGLTADFRIAHSTRCDTRFGSFRCPGASGLHLVALSVVYSPLCQCIRDIGNGCSSRTTFEPSDLYNVSKLMGESLCLNSGRNGMRIARLSNVVGFDPDSDNSLPALIKEALAGSVLSCGRH